MPGPSQVERERVLERLNDSLDKRIEQQAAATSAIDTKANFVVGFIVIGFQVFVGLDHSQPWAGLAYAAFAVAFGFGVTTFALRRFKVLFPAAMLDDYNDLCDDVDTENLYEYMLAGLAGTKNETLSENEKVNRPKVAAWWASVVFLALAMVFSAISVSEASNGKLPARHRRGHDRAAVITCSSPCCAEARSCRAAASLDW